MITLQSISGWGEQREKRQLSSEHKKIVNYWNCLKPQRNENFARERTKKKASAEPRRSFVFMKAKQLAAVSHFCGSILRSIAFSLAARLEQYFEWFWPEQRPSKLRLPLISIMDSRQPTMKGMSVSFSTVPEVWKTIIARPPLNGSLSVMFRSGCTRLHSIGWIFDFHHQLT